MGKEILTGRLTYNEIEYNFVFSDNLLSLIPPKEKNDDIKRMFMEELKKGVYTCGKPVYIKDILIGRINETNKKIIFFPSENDIGKNNSVLKVGISYYIINKYDRENIDRISIKGPEINYIYPTTNALNKIDWHDNGEIGISTKSFENTTSDKETFAVDGKNVSINFGISFSCNYSIGKSPLDLNSNILIEFEPTSDYKFILKVINIVKQLIQFMCYRKNIFFSEIILETPYENAKHESFATLYDIIYRSEIEYYPVEKGRFIKYEYLKGCLGQILTDISNDNLYIRHISESYEQSKHIDAGKFVMITAAFEWEFKRSYPNGIQKSVTRIESEEKVTKIIDKEIGCNSGKVKEIFKFLKKMIISDNLESKIITYGNDYKEISDMFGNFLYSLNNEILKYNEMGKRLADQRNNYAHGNIDQDFKDLALLDLIYLERIVYIIQLKYYNVDNLLIQKAINELFCCRLAL